MKYFNPINPGTRSSNMKRLYLLLETPAPNPASFTSFAYENVLG
jgi:hypothetical protein